MKKLLLAVFVCSAVFGSCNKDREDTPIATSTCDSVETTAPASEVADLQAYISSRAISAEADRRGFFYTITRQGTGIAPTPCSSVRVAYTLRLSNGTEVEAANGAQLDLDRLIVGWREGLPLIGKGGAIILYLPPSLAYGAQGSSKVPANAILVFSIDLLDVF
jgi:FKBP-type peptidyl-prolyl cis-trans isomerase